MELTRVQRSEELFSKEVAPRYIPTGEGMSVPPVPLKSVFLPAVILAEMRGYLVVALICLSLMASDMELLFKCFLLFIYLP